MKLYKYTPALIDPQIVDAALVGRKAELDTIKSALINAAAGNSLDHLLIIGPKGIGKSHILRVVYNALAGKTATAGLVESKDAFIPVIFSEEEYPTNLTKLVLLIIKHLRGVDSAPPVPQELTGPAVIGERERQIALEYLEEFRRCSGKILLLLIDNLNDILEKLTVEDQGALRNILMTAGSVLLIGATPTLFDAVIAHDRPLYNFFHLIWLPDLTFGETQALLRRYAELYDNRELIDRLKVDEPKLRALHELAGGNPRLILSLYHIMSEGDITSIEDMFLSLLDELSPYFRERMRDLSAQQQEIMGTMAMAERLMTPTEIAAACQLPVNAVNSQIKRLEKLGYIRKSPAKKGKRVLYDVSERLFALWRQMRVEAGRTRLGFLIKFLEVWFTPDERRALLDMNLLLIAGTGVRDSRRALEDYLNNVWYLKEAIPDYKARDEFMVAVERDNLLAAAAILENQLSADPDNVQKLVMLGIIKQWLGQLDQSVVILEKSTKIDPENLLAWTHLGSAYAKQNKTGQAFYALGRATQKARTMKDEIVIYRQTNQPLGKSDVAVLALFLIMIAIFLTSIDNRDQALFSSLLDDALGLLPSIEDPTPAYAAFALTMNETISKMEVDFLSTALKRIKANNNEELIQFLSPYFLAVDYLEKRDSEILDRLRPEEKSIVQDIISKLETNKKPRKKKAGSREPA